MKKDRKKPDKSAGVRICSVGGEALMEGIMMRAPAGYSQVVRNPEGNLDVEIKIQKPLSKRNKFFSLPVIRGFVSLIDSLSTGMKCLFRSAEISGLEAEVPPEEMSRFDRFLTEKLGDKLPNIIMTLSLILAVTLSVGLFFLLPNVIASLLIKKEQSSVLYNLIEGVIRIVIFIGYMFLVSRMKDIKRVFMYHGAEHKTIHCFEHMDELTVENVRKYTKHHPRCGTAFMFVIMIISILIYSLLPRLDFFLWNILLRIVTLPLIAGIGYEFNRFCGKYENVLTKILRAPGMAMQRLTTVEPDDSMITVAIVALTKALELNETEPSSDPIHYLLDPNGNSLPDMTAEKDEETVENPA